MIYGWIGDKRCVRFSKYIHVKLEQNIIYLNAWIHSIKEQLFRRVYFCGQNKNDKQIYVIVEIIIMMIVAHWHEYLFKVGFCINFLK